MDGEAVERQSPGPGEIGTRAAMGQLGALLMGRTGTATTWAPAMTREVVSLAIRHGIGPWLHSRIKSGDTPLTDREQRWLHDAYVACAALNMRLFDALRGILRRCEADGTPVIPLKGACLAERVYGDIALRPMADIDLLVRPADLPRAVESLRQLGYESDQPFDPAAQQGRFQDMPPMRRPGGVLVELHWTLVTPLCGARIDDDERQYIWERSAPATIAGAPARALSPEDLLLHLCMHASVHHRFADVGLKSFVDMAEVVRHYERTFDWPAFAARASKWGVSNGVRMALMLAREWTDLRVPSGAWAQLDGADPDEETLEWARHKVLEGASTALVGEFARLESGGGATGKLSTLRAAAFPPRAVLARLYGVSADSWWVFAWYPYRLWDLLSRYHRALWKLFRRDAELVDATCREARLREYLGWK